MKNKLIDIAKDISKRIPENKRHIVLIFCGIVLMLLILIPEISISDKEKDEVNKADAVEAQSAYTEQMEKRLCDLISSIKGAGKTKVMLTLESGEENVYASDINDDKTEYVVIKTDSGENGMIVKIVKPEIRGVAVVCEGGDIASVKIAVTNAVCTSLGISSTKISIAKMKDRSD